MCRSSSYFSDLSNNDKLEGTKIFRYLLETIRPKIIILFGKGTRKQFAKCMTATSGNWKTLDDQLVKIHPEKGDAPKSLIFNDANEVFCIPGLGGDRPFLGARATGGGRLDSLLPGIGPRQGSPESYGMHIGVCSLNYTLISAG